MYGKPSLTFMRKRAHYNLELEKTKQKKPHNISMPSFKLQSQKSYLQTCVPNEDSDQPAHFCSLIRIFTGCILDSQVCSLYMWSIKTLKTDAQADSSLLWDHVRKYVFSQCGPYVLFIVLPGYVHFIYSFSTQADLKLCCSHTG